jgi:pyridoxal phosphate enzyme (YggS family)
MGNICGNIKSIRDKVDSVNVSGGIVNIVAVTKTFSYSDVDEVLQCGIKHIGESKIQEALPKFNQISAALNGITKHFIGHLQTNKAKKAVENFDLIQSLDSIKLAQVLDNYAFGLGKVQDCLIEVKVSSESAKTGVLPDEAKSFYERCLELKNISIKGLMTIAPNVTVAEQSSRCFRRTRDLFDDIKNSFNKKEFSILSMGMSADYEIAVQEGANLIRIGSAIFGERNYGEV